MIKDEEVWAGLRSHSIRAANLKRSLQKGPFLFSIFFIDNHNIYLSKKALELYKVLWKLTVKISGRSGYQYSHDNGFNPPFNLV